VLEASLHDARALERVGRVAIALSHEFSELLTAISGSAELIAGELAPRDVARGDIDTIRRAAERAAVLTRELARSSTARTTSPQRTDLSRAIAALEATLHRIVGDQVRVVLDLATDAGQSIIDLSQLEASILHLARNARDAMPAGGELRICTSGAEYLTPRRAVHAVVRPGRYACVEVRDSGVGMDAITRERCFEPLFSTRGREGLGLSHVFGSTTQMGGSPLRANPARHHLPLSSRRFQSRPAHRSPASHVPVVVDDEETDCRRAFAAPRGIAYRRRPMPMRR
jgi:signal transduction histidine kinase